MVFYCFFSCPKPFKTQESRANHHKNKHTPDRLNQLVVVKPYPCYSCGITFLSDGSLRNHRMKCESEVNDSNYSEFNDTTQSEVGDSDNSEVGDISDSEVSDIQKSEVSDIQKSEVGDIQNSEVSDIIKSEVGDMNNSEVGDIN